MKRTRLVVEIIDLQRTSHMHWIEKPAGTERQFYTHPNGSWTLGETVERVVFTSEDKHWLTIFEPAGRSAVNYAISEIFSWSVTPEVIEDEEAVNALDVPTKESIDCANTCNSCQHTCH